MKALLRLLVGVCPDRELSVVSYQPSESSCQLSPISHQAKLWLIPKTYYILSANQLSAMRNQPSAFDSWLPAKSLIPKAYNLIAFLILVFVSCGAALAQESVVQTTPAAKAETEITPLKIGDKIPNELWDLPLQVVNHPEGKETITLNEYRGKLIIIDFWSSWCSSCIEKMSHMQYLQEKNDNDIYILHITKQDANSVHKARERNNIIQQFKLPIAVNDNILNNLFPHRIIPHVIWISNEGKLLAQTSSSYVQEKTIDEALFSNSLNWPVKEEIETLYNSAFSPVASEFDISSDSFYYSSILPRRQGVNNYYTEIDSVGNKNSIKLMNHSIFNLYLKALGKFPYSPVVVWNNVDPERVVFSPKSSPFLKDDWYSKNAISYEAVLPIHGNWRNKLFSDLNFYLGFDVKIENKIISCYELKSGSKETREINPIPEKRDEENYLSFPSTGKFIVYMNQVTGMKPFINGSTHPFQELYIPKKAINDIESLRAVLKDFDLELLDVERERELIIFNKL